MYMFLTISALLVICCTTLALPFGTSDEGVESSLQTAGLTETADNGLDLSEFVQGLINLRASARDVLRDVESTLAFLQPAAQHNIRKRQTSVDASVENGPNGPRGSVDVNHKDSNGGNYGAGVSHDNSGTSVHGSYDKTFNNGNSKVSVSGGRDSNGDNYGRIDISHDF